MLRISDFLSPASLSTRFPPQPRLEKPKPAAKRPRNPRSKPRKTDVSTSTTTSHKKQRTVAHNINELQFVYRKLSDDDEKESLVACTSTDAMPLTERFDFADYAACTNTLPFPPMFQELVQRAIQHELHPPTVPSYDLQHFTGLLRANQVEAVEFVLARQRAILALPTGVGKTAISYAVIATQWEQIVTTSDERVLVICPASLRENWLSDGKNKFFTSHIDQVAIIWSSDQADKILLDATIRVVIVSYNLLFPLFLKLAKYRWYMLVCDEAHYLQSSKSQCSQVVAELRKHVSWIILCSATPCDNTIVYWNLLATIEPDIFEHFFHWKPPHIKWPTSTSIFYYAERYVLPEVIHTPASRGGGGLKWAFKKSLRRNELHALCRQFVLQQRKEDVLQDVLPCKHEVITIGRAAPEAKKSLQSAMEHIIEVEQKKGSTYANALFMEQVHETARQKIPFILTYVRELVASNPALKFILFAYHKDVLNALSAELNALKIKHVLVHGNVNKKLRPQLFKQLETDPETSVGVFSLACCSVGLNFTFLQLLVFAELIFSAKNMTQAGGRTERIGQTGQSIARYLMLEDSTDQLVWTALQRKRDNENVILRNEHKKLNYAKLWSLCEPTALVTRHQVQNDDDFQQPYDDPEEVEDQEEDLQ